MQSNGPTSRLLSQAERDAITGFVRYWTRVSVGSAALTPLFLVIGFGIYLWGQIPIVGPLTPLQNLEVFASVFSLIGALVTGVIAVVGFGFLRRQRQVAMAVIERGTAWSLSGDAVRLRVGRGMDTWRVGGITILINSGQVRLEGLGPQFTMDIATADPLESEDKHGWVVALNGQPLKSPSWFGTA